MQRSRTQISTVYAPGALFTYEGGLGCCVSVPVSAPAQVSPPVQRQIFDHLRENVESWFERAMQARQQPSIFPEQCLEGDFLNHKQEPVADQGRFVLCQPSKMGFVPDPLVFMCSNRDCGVLAEFNSPEEMQREWTQLQARTDCAHGANKKHDWRQLDVVFAHWAGTYAGLSPYRNVMGPRGGAEKVRRCPNCNTEEYKLITKGSAFFSDWKFQCVGCLTLKDVVQADRETLELLKPRMDRGEGSLPKEWNMLPVSYRASSVFYPQKDSFIVFEDLEVSSLMTPPRRDDLVARIMKLFDFPGTPLDRAEVDRQLRQNGRAKDADEYASLAAIADLVPEPHKSVQLRALAEKRARYEAEKLITKQHAESPRLRQQVDAHLKWARRYNPIRLALEHASLRAEVIEREGSDPALPAISVLNPDVCDIDPQDGVKREAYRRSVEAKLTRMGLDEIVLLRGLKICEFSFGYTRVSSTPVVSIKERDMPVRLRAFGHVERNKRPIYVLEQKNEGFYVRLNAARVRRWLDANGLGAGLPPRDGMALGGLLIETYQDFGRFLEAYRERAVGATQRSLSNCVYLLLHTMAHHFAQSIIEYSGLDHGSIGEYVFPADLAFLVYRKGMTPDLGNLSAMWRNHSEAVLDRLLWERGLKCDGGSLCDQRGGACPACIMAPDVACICGNNLLSRAALNGGHPPGWDTQRTALTGFFRVPQS